MKLTNGKADAQLVNKLLKEKLGDWQKLQLYSTLAAYCCNLILYTINILYIIKMLKISVMLFVKNISKYNLLSIVEPGIDNLTGLCNAGQASIYLIDIYLI